MDGSKRDLYHVALLLGIMRYHQHPPLSLSIPLPLSLNYYLEMLSLPLFFCLWSRKGKNNVLKSYNVGSYDYLKEKGDEIYGIDFPYVKHPVPTF